MIHRFCLALLVACALPLAAMAQMGPPQDRYIVVLNEGLDLPEDVAVDVAIRTGGQVGYVYEHALRGFAITMPRAALAGVQRDPRVSYVEEDKPVSIFAQTVPTGIQRIFADENGNIGIDGIDDDRVDVDVAVLDTGIDFEHPDLNVVGGTDCSGGGPFNSSCNDAGGDDDHFHGTHVAGTIAAIDNGEGVVGVAPGARLWAVKVLDKRGSGYMSWIIAGIDWVAARAGEIEVANMSLGGSGFHQGLYDAIQGAVDAGVAFAVAAGNSDDDASKYSPAAFDNVLTVSALADFDGEPDGLGSPTCRKDQDDTLADFSNWGEAVDIAAPGVCILSTYPIEQGSYDTISGTSMASPHVAGALALLASSSNPGNATDVYNLYNQVVNAGNDGWADESGDGVKEPLLDVSNTTTFNPTLIAGSGESSDTNSAPTASFTVACTDLSCNLDGTGSSDSDGSISSYDWDFGDGNTASGVTVSHTYGSSGDYTVTLTVTDDGGKTDSESKMVSVSVSDGTGDANDMYVSDIDMAQKAYGPGGSFRDLETTIIIHRDSDGDGTAEPGQDDDPVGSAEVTVRFDGPDGERTLSVQTDSTGSGTIIRKRVDSGDYTATVIEVLHSNYVWNATLDVEPSESCSVGDGGSNPCPIK